MSVHIWSYWVAFVMFVHISKVQKGQDCICIKDISILMMDLLQKSSVENNCSAIMHD